MMRYFLLFVFLFSFAACCSKKNTTVNSAVKNLNHKIALHISLTAENLSEDGSKLFSQNDEIVFLAYIVNHDTTQLPQLILSQYFVFDSLKRNADFISDSIVSTVKGNLSFLMIEIDDDKNKEQIEPVVRLNLNKINTAYLRNDVTTLNKFFGDNDLLGIRTVDFQQINITKKNSIVISGQNLFDAYKYDLTFQQ